MKKYLFGLLAIIAAVGISSFTKPTNDAFVNYYRFSYISSNGYSEAAIEDERPQYWGYGTIVTQLDDFTLACDDINNKACEIIVPEASVVPVLVNGVFKLRLKSVTSGDSGANLVTINAIMGSTINLFFVKISLSINVIAIMSKS